MTISQCSTNKGWTPVSNFFALIIFIVQMEIIFIYLLDCPINNSHADGPRIRIHIDSLVHWALVYVHCTYCKYSFHMGAFSRIYSGFMFSTALSRTFYIYRNLIYSAWTAFVTAESATHAISLHCIYEYVLVSPWKQNRFRKRIQTTDNWEEKQNKKAVKNLVALPL